VKVSELNRLYTVKFSEVESNRISIKQKDDELAKLYEQRVVLKQGNDPQHFNTSPSLILTYDPNRIY